MIEIIVGAIGFRLRGSAIFEQWTGRGATTARIVCWAIPMGLMSLFTLPWEYAIAAGVAFWLGCLPGWYGVLDLGRDEGNKLKEFILMSGRGILWTLPAALVFAFISPLNAVALLIAGALCPVAYEIGWHIPSKVENMRSGPEIGEILFGALVGAALAF
jgi:hypothetical protein